MNLDLSSCSSRPQTAAGAAYLRVAADPCGENLPPDFKGIPDGSETDIVNLRMRDDLVLAPPSDLIPDGLWALIIFDTPYFIYQQIMIRYRLDLGPPGQNDVRNFINGLTRSEITLNATFPNWYRPIRRANEDYTTPTAPAIVVLPATAPWEVTFLKPAVLGAFDTNPDSAGWAYIRKFRFVSKGRTLHLNAPATATQGRVVSGQLGTESSVKTISQVNDVVVLVQPFPCRFTVTPPFDFNTLPQQDLNARQDIIKTGSYDMQRHWNGSHLWNEIEDVRPIWRADSTNLTALYSIQQIFTPPLGPAIDTTELLKYDGFDVSLGWTVTHIDGMSSQATVHMKHRSYWEVNVPGNSPWAANKQSPCPHDPGALSLEKQIGPCIPHSFEAKYNDMGLLAGLIRSVTSVGKPILAAGMRGALSGIMQRLPRNVVIDDPYNGIPVYGESRFVGPSNGKNGNGNGNGNGNNRRRRKR